MRRVRIFVAIMVLGLWAAGCATRFEVVELPERSADLYPLALARSGTTVAVDEIHDVERARRYFGIDLLKRDVLPVNIVVSNRRSEPVLVKPADVMLHRGNQIIDPLPLGDVAALAKSQGRQHRKTREQVDAYYREIAFKTTTVAPNDTYQGVLFFPIEQAKTRRERWFRRVSLWIQGDMQLDVVVETAQQRERLRYGPFGLTGPRHTDWF